MALQRRLLITRRPDVQELVSQDYNGSALLAPVPLAGMHTCAVLDMLSKLWLVSIQGGVPHIAIPGQSRKDVEGQVCAGRLAAILAILQAGQQLTSCMGNAFFEVIVPVILQSPAAIYRHRSLTGQGSSRWQSHSCAS